MYYAAIIPNSEELYHYGVAGMKWGVRRYQNPDGSLTAAGLARYGNLSRSQRNDLANYGTRGFARMQRMQKRGYSQERARRYEQDRRKFGKKGAKRIQKGMNRDQRRYDRAKERYELTGQGRPIKDRTDVYGSGRQRSLERSRRYVKRALGVVAGVAVGVYAIKHRKQIAAGAKTAGRILKKSGNAVQWAKNASQGYKAQRFTQTAKDTIRRFGRDVTQRRAVFTEKGRAVNRSGRRYIRRASQTPERFAGRTVQRARFR